MQRVIELRTNDQKWSMFLGCISAANRWTLPKRIEFVQKRTQAMNKEVQDLLNAHFAKWPQAVAGSVGEDEIQQSEQQIGVELPEDFRSFIRQFGSAALRSVSILGLRQCEFSNDSQSTFVDQTIFFRRELPGEYSEIVVISIDGSGNPIGFLNGIPTIFVFDFNFGGRHDLADSFTEFVRLAMIGQLDV